MPRRRACCFLIPGDWFTPTGGYTYDRRLVQSLSESGWEVDVLRLDGTWPAPDAQTRAAASSMISALPDGTSVVVDGLAFGALEGVVRAHAERLRWVALVHHPLHLETGLDEIVRGRLLATEARALQLARRVVVTSASTVGDVAAMGVPRERISVIEPGTDPVQRAAGARTAVGGGPVRLLCVATLTPRKGHAVLLQALTGLSAPDWELHNVGSLTRDPATAARLQEMSAAAPLAGRVFWHGTVDGPTLQAHYAAADLLVLPSLHEGYGMVVAEALVAGLPVLASRAGALAHTVPAQAGLLVPPADIDALRAALERLIAEPGLRARLAAGARSAAGHLPTWETQAARFALVLEGLE
ncbi:MAG: glycosyltransferase family 4 protein [Burkholderiaceae bacterium]